MRVAIYGSRPDGHAKVVLDFFGDQPELEFAGLLDDLPENAGRTIGQLRVVGGAADLPRLAADEGLEGVVLGFGAARGRARIIAAVRDAGLALPILVHPTAHVSASAELADGVQVLPKASVGADVRLGLGVLVNTGAVLEHDDVVGDASVIDPGAVLAGRVTVGEEVEVGSGAVLIPDVTVSDGALVGAGAVVVSSVVVGETVVGVPARPLRRG